MTSRRRHVMVAALMAAAVACSQNGNAPADAITDTTWTLVEVNGSPVDTAGTDRPATLMLAADGRASGNGGCNQFGGPYTLNGDELRFGGIAMTRMACPGRMDVETAYATVFDATRTWRVRDGMLELLAGDRVLARFRR